jgi:hypothetical protein
VNQKGQGRRILAFASGFGWLSFYPLPILNILVPQVAHTPRVAALPFFIVIALARFICFFERHFMQYESDARAREASSARVFQ